MSLRIVTADERLSAANARTTMAIFGPSGVGKTNLLRTLDPRGTLAIDLEAGMKSVQDWPGDSIPVRCFADAVDIACLVGGVDPAADSNAFYSEAHYRHLADSYPDLVAMIATKSIIFVDSITELTRQAMDWAKTQPDAYSEKTGRPDTRGAYGLLARTVIRLLKHIQHAPGKTTIFVGILERVTDDMNRTIWAPQIEGGKVGRELPGVVDQVVTMGLFSPEPGAGVEGRWRYDPDRGTERRLVCRAGNPWGLPAKDRSGRLDLTEAPDLGRLLSKINLTAKG